MAPMNQGSSHTMQLQVDTESWAYKVPFRVSRGAESALDVVVVTLTDSDGHVGRGEAAGWTTTEKPFHSCARRSKRFDRQSNAGSRRMGPPPASPPWRRCCRRAV